MKKLFKWSASTLVIGVAFTVFCILAAMPVLAYAFRAQVSIQETAGNSYDMLGANWTQRNTWLANNGYMNSTANDTRVQTLGGIDKPHMVADNKTLVAIPVGAYSQNNLYFVTGETEQENMYVIPGYGGYVTTLDNAALELGDNFTVSSGTGYINTDNGTSKYIIDKDDAFTLRVSDNESGLLQSGIYGNHIADTITDVSASWTNEANASDGATATAATEAIDVEWTGFIQLSFNEYILSDGVRFYAGILNNVGADLIDVDAFYNGGWQDVYQGTFTDDTWTTKAYADSLLHSCNGTRVRIYNAANNGETARVGELQLNGYYPYVTASSISSGELDVVVAAGNFTTLGTGNALHFDGTANSYLNMGNIYSSEPDLWILSYFSLESGWSAGMGNKFLYAKEQDANNRILVFMANDGKLHIYKKSLGVDRYELSTAQSTWTAGVVYGVLYSQSSVNGARVITSSGETLTNADVTASASGGNLVFGSSAAGGAADGITGTISYIVSGNDTLTSGEETGLFNGIIPADADDIWYEEEGHGNNIISYGTVGNDGTAGSSTYWTQATRPGDITLWIDGTPYGTAHMKGASVPNNANAYNFMYNAATDFMPYAEYIKLAVDGTQVAWYQPNSIIETTVLPNRVNPGTNDGAFTWGGNPAGVSVTLGSMESYGQSAVIDTSTDPTSDILPVVGGSDWDEMPDTAGTLAANPFYPVVEFLGTNTTLSEMQWWRISGIVLVAMTLVLVGSRVRGHHLITGIMTGAMIGLMVQQTIFPMWSLVFSILLVLGGIISERARQL